MLHWQTLAEKQSISMILRGISVALSSASSMFLACSYTVGQFSASLSYKKGAFQSLNNYLPI